MKERPIIMGAESVRAILEGRKTQTRRVVNNKALERFRFSPSGELLGSFDESHPEWEIYPTVDDAQYQVGDRLWVRETWGQCHPISVQNGRLSIDGTVDIQGPPKVRYRIIYGADGEVDEVWECDEFPFRTKKPSNTTGEFAYWKSPIFMPRWASRITLEITDIRVERVQDITEDDALAEGVISNEEYESRASEDNLFPCPRCKGYQIHEAFGYDYGITEVDCTYCDTQKKRYRIVWDSLNAKRGYPFESNPWVWAVTFKVVQ